MNWSGGKDSSLALMKVLNQELFEVSHLLTSMNSTYNRISMHGVRRELLEAQAKSLHLPLHTLELPEQPSMEEYEKTMENAVSKAKSNGITHTIFGDIFLEDLKKYREDKLKPLGICAHFPLWKRDTKELMQEFLAVGFKAIVVCVNANVLDPSFCGRLINQSFVDDLPEDVDVCGENGEYHSFVYDGPIFKQPILLKKGEIVHRTYKKPNSTSNDVCRNSPIDKNLGFYFCDLTL